jgi:hypothetical protein
MLKVLGSTPFHNRGGKKISAKKTNHTRSKETDFISVKRGNNGQISFARNEVKVRKFSKGEGGKEQHE